MVTRRVSLALIAFASLTACSIDNEKEETSWIENITISGDVGSPPEASAEGNPDGINGFEQIVNGEGIEVADGSLLVIGMVSYEWDSGALNETMSSYDIGLEALFSFDEFSDFFPENKEAPQLNVGSRWVLVESDSHSPDTAELWVFDLLDHYHPMQTISGEIKEDDDPNLPMIKQDQGSAPVIRVPAVDPPEELSVTPLISGNGDEIIEGDQVVVQFSTVKWDGAMVIDSTWQDSGIPQEFVLGFNMVFPAWEKALIGATVGSRLLIVAPPSEAFGDRENFGNGISADDSIIFLIDVLGSH